MITYHAVPEIFEMAGILSFANLSVNYFEITNTIKTWMALLQLMISMRLFLRCVFTSGTRTIREGCECRQNGKVQHSYFRLQKFVKHARGFGSVVNCNVCGMLDTFTPGMFGDFWSLNYECWTLPFCDIRILRESFAFPWKHTSSVNRAKEPRSA